MDNQPLYDFAQSDGSGILLIFLAVFAIGAVAVGARFFSGRLIRASELKAVVRKKESVRSLTPYEQLRIKDFFAREIQTRHLEGYQSKTGDVGREVFCIEGPAKQHSVTTTRGVIYTYQTMSGLEMLVPTAAMPYLRNTNNRVEFVMVGELAYVIKLNDQFELVRAKSESDQESQPPTVLGDSQASRRLYSSEILGDQEPSNSSLYLKSIRGDRLLVSGHSEFGVGLDFILGAYWLLLFAVCGFAPLVLVPLGALFGNLELGVELGRETFLFLWPFGVIVLLTLPFIVIYWIVRRVMPPRDYVLVLNRKNKQVFFYHQGMKPVRVDWNELYSLIETTRWMTSYGWSMCEVLLEVATEDRDSDERISVRLKYSTDIEALGDWRAMQEFINGNLNTLNFGSGKSDIRSGESQKKQLFNLKNLIRIVLYWLLGGPLPRLMDSWMFWQRQQFAWRRVNSAKTKAVESL